MSRSRSGWIIGLFGVSAVLASLALYIGSERRALAQANLVLTERNSALEQANLALAQENSALARDNLSLGAELAVLRDFRGLSRPAGFDIVDGIPVGHPEVRGLDEHDGCVVPRLASGVCPNASTRVGPVPEMRIARELSAARSVAPPSAVEGASGIADLVARALGWSALVVDEDAIAIDGFRDQGDGLLVEEGYVRFAHPEVRVRFLEARTRSRSRDAVILLHGHVSTPEKMIGLDRDDYARAIGSVLLAEDFDVLAIETTYDPIASSFLNAQLSLFGTQIYGLWSRAVCELAELKRERGARRVFLYGISNGGKIAHFSSLLCEHFDLVIVDDIITDWPSYLRKQTTIHFNQNYAVHFLAPLLSEVSVRDLVTSVRNVTVFTRSGAALAALLDAVRSEPIEFSLGSNIQSPGGDDARSLIVEKRHDDHIAEIELTLSLLRGERVAAKAVF